MVWLSQSSISRSLSYSQLRHFRRFRNINCSRIPASYSINDKFYGPLNSTKNKFADTSNIGNRSILPGRFDSSKSDETALYSVDLYTDDSGRRPATKTIIPNVDDVCDDGSSLPDSELLSSVVDLNTTRSSIIPLASQNSAGNRVDWPSVSPLAITGHKPVNIRSLLNHSAGYSDLLAGCLETDWSTLPYPPHTVKTLLTPTSLRKASNKPAADRRKLSTVVCSGGPIQNLNDENGEVVPDVDLELDSQPRELNANDTTALLFPGQGTQFVGMGLKLAAYPNVPQLYAAASDIIGFDLYRMCTEGPALELNKTSNTQLAVLVTSLAAVERLRVDCPMAIENCLAAAGFSVGEYAALVFGGAISFEEAVKLVKLRGQLMQTASEAAPSGMMTVFENAGSRLAIACEVAREFAKTKGVEKPICQVCSHLFTQTKVIGGHEVCLSFIHRNAEEFNLKGRRMKRLAVSGAFHTPLMNSAIEPFKEALELANLVRPVIDVYSNVDGLPYNQDIRQMRKKLTKQVARTVKWEQVIHRLFDSQKAQYPRSYEVGPGNQLGTMLRGANGKAHQFYTSVDV